MDAKTRSQTAMSALELATPRLLLRPFTTDDVDDLQSMDGDARVMRFLGNGLAPHSRGECEASLQRMANHYRDHPGHGLLHARTRGDGRFVGGCGLFRVHDGDDIEIAYRLPVACWGRGFATEMARAVLAHGFALGLERVIGLTWPENVASQRVLEHIGMRRQGSGRYYGREMLVFVATATGTAGATAYGAQ
jgi:RimJ/RimL family protein N-acetyltransferase